jgi:glycosyltransferase involved in cell wall biosynthesis
MVHDGRRPVLERRMRLSIITPTIDSAVFIDEAVASVLSAKKTEIEHIIVHDGSKEYTAALAAKYPHLKILTGPGSGATPAVAVGNAAASGDFIGYLSSDDRLRGPAIDVLSRAIHDRPAVRIWTGGTRIFRHGEDGREKTTRVLMSPKLTVASLSNVLDDLPLITARFIHRSVYAELGNLDPRFPISSDREFMVRVAMAGIADAPFDTIVSELRQHEGSRTMNRTGFVVMAYLAEHLQIADMWLSRPDIPFRAKHLFRRWRSREVLRLAVAQARAGLREQALATLWQETLHDPLLPIWAPSSILAWRRRRRTARGQRFAEGLSEVQR